MALLPRISSLVANCSAASFHQPHQYLWKVVLVWLNGSTENKELASAGTVQQQVGLLVHLMWHIAAYSTTARARTVIGLSELGPIAACGLHEATGLQHDGPSAVQQHKVSCPRQTC